MMDELQQLEEANLVLLAQEGDAGAFRQLVELYDRRLLYFIRRLLNETEEAFDVLQEVWLRVHRSLHKLRSPRAFRVWIYRIAHAQVMSALRRKRVLVTYEELPLDQVPDVTLTETSFEAADAVHAALETLSLDHRRVLTLRFLEDMSVEDIAFVLECKAGTVKSRLHYAKAALGRRIEEENNG
ncbi:MAG: RNA polymerase sigma factor [Planctomycetaceae bacterium]